MPTGEGGWTTAIAAGVCRLARPGGPVRWLSTGVEGGYRRAPAAYNVTVPEGFDRTDPVVYAAERRREAGFERAGPALLTGVEQTHAVGTRLAPVTVVATVGLSNPARLPVDASEGATEVGADAPAGPPGEPVDADRAPSDGAAGTAAAEREEDSAAGRGDAGSSGRDEGVESRERGGRVGTVNLLVGTERALEEGALASLLATVVEAKAATLVPLTGFSGTTSDAVVVGTARECEPAPFAGSATPVGAAARACVRTAVVGGLRSRYAETPIPESVAAADHGVVTDERARVFEP